MRTYSVWTYISFTGGIVMLAALFSLSDGHTGNGRIGLVGGGTLIVFSEWSRWRRRGG